MSIEFIGNKRNLESFIIENIEAYINPKYNTCLDLFSGSGSISAALKRKGYNVVANDFLNFSTVFTKSLLLNDSPPRFSKIIRKINISNSGEPYNEVLNYLNSLSGKEGFIYKNYSPASSEHGDIERKYFTEENAKKIDAIRIQIEEWAQLLDEKEKALLMSDLLKAVLAVSNIAGTYGCYMKFWKKRALNEIKLIPTEFIKGKNGAIYKVHNEDANVLIKCISADIIYADPPYTKRQYSAYYHILETIALYDNPKIFGKTGLRDWKEKASDFCYKSKAPNALADLVSNAQCKYFILSYSDEGQIPHIKIMDILMQYGKVIVCETPYKKYKSNTTKTRKNVIEKLYILEMENQKNDFTGQTSATI